jgi:hypothetical protein
LNNFLESDAEAIYEVIERSTVPMSVQDLVYESFVPASRMQYALAYLKAKDAIVEVEALETVYQKYYKKKETSN